MTRAPLTVVSRMLAGVAISFVLFTGAAAFAEAGSHSGTVVVLQPASASPVAQRATALIRDELLADRFHVTVADTVAETVTSSEDRDVSSVLALFGEPEDGQAELCLFQRAGRRFVVRRAFVNDDVEQIPQALAKRALELLRATALELAIEAEPATVAAVPESHVSSSPVAAPEASRVAVEAGLSLWSNVGGPSTAAIPAARVALRLSDWLWLRAGAAGLGSRPQLQTPYGWAAVSQSMALMDCVAVFRRGQLLRPLVSVGAGALHVAVDGTGTAPFEGRDSASWSAAIDGGVGADIALGERMSLATELHALLASPHPVVRFADTRAATVGYPAFILSLSLRVTP